MKVILTASGTFALPSLEIMAARLTPDNLMVISQPDRRRGRGRRYHPTPIKFRALELGLSVISPEKLGKQEDMKIFSDFAADFLVVIDYGQLIPHSLITLPRQAAINLHPSLLPAYRGPAPIVWSLLQGDSVTGVTTQLLADKIDSGDILLQKKTEIKASETGTQLTERLQNLGAELVWETLEKWQEGLIKPVPQDNDKASYAPKLHKHDGLLDWNQDVHEIERRIRALNPWPGTFTFWRGKRLKILEAAISPIVIKEVPPPGTIQVKQGQLYTACGHGFLLISKVQPEGRRPQNAGDFLRGHHVTAGQQFNSQEKVLSP